MRWRRSLVSPDAWLDAAARLHSGECSLLGLWGEYHFAHMAVIEVKTGECGVLSIACEASHFPSIGRLHPPAIRLERAMHDLVGLEPDGSPFAVTYTAEDLSDLVAARATPAGKRIATSAPPRGALAARA